MIKLPLHLKSLKLRLAGEHLLGPLTLSINPGEITTLMGASGCGKSSLLSAIVGLLDAPLVMSGQIFLGEEEQNNLPTEQRKIGLMLQQPMLFPNMNVEQNLAFALPHGLTKAERNARVKQALNTAQLEELALRDIKNLSGGQAARIALWRTLLSEPRALLLDEPFSHLDRELRSKTCAYVYQYIQMSKIPTLLVTHDIECCPKNGKRILVERDGTIKRVR